MHDSEPARRRRFQFGLRALLTVVTLLALLTGWIGHLNRRAAERTRLTAELVSGGILVDLEEPNWLGQLAKKLAPQRDAWLRERLGSGWLGHPTVFCCWELKEEQVPATVERIKRLGTVREFHFRREPSPQVAATMHRELPGIDVLTTNAAIRTYYQRRLTQPVFAFEGAAILALLVLGAIAAVLWPLMKLRFVSSQASA
jgi:hypothetical protein